MEVGIQNRHYGSIGVLAKFTNSLAHFFGRLTRVNGDDPLGAFYESLVRKTVAHQRPNPWADLVEAASQNFGLLSVALVNYLPTGKRDRFGIVMSK